MTSGNNEGMCSSVCGIGSSYPAELVLMCYIVCHGSFSPLKSFLNAEFLTLNLYLLTIDQVFSIFYY